VSPVTARQHSAPLRETLRFNWVAPKDSFGAAPPYEVTPPTADHHRPPRSPRSPRQAHNTHKSPRRLRRPPSRGVCHSTGYTKHNPRLSFSCSNAGQAPAVALASRRP